MNELLPLGWTWTTLEQIVTSIRNGISTKPAGEEGVPILRISAVRPNALDLTDVRYLADLGAVPDDYRLCPGDLLFTRYNGSRALVGVCASVPDGVGDVVYPDKLIRVRVQRDAVVPQFVQYAANAGASRVFIQSRARTTAGQTGVSGADLRAMPMPLAPLAEQHRIVAALEEHLSALDAAVAGLERARVNIERYRLAVRAAAVAESESESAEQLTVGQLAQVGTGATPLRSRSAYYENGTIPWVTSGALNAGVVREASDFVTDLALRETNLTLYPPGTLLVAMYGEGKTRGRCAELAIHATTNQAIAAIRVRPERADVGPWLRLVLDASYEAMRRSASGGVQPNLNLSIVRAIPVPLPARSERERILSGVERCLGAADRAAVDIDTQLARAARLRQSILKAAFEGKLVTQDPTDEPAAVLLNRINAQHVAPVSAPRAPAKTKSTRRTTRR